MVEVDMLAQRYEKYSESRTFIPFFSSIEIQLKENAAQIIKFVQHPPSASSLIIISEKSYSLVI